GGIAAHRHAGWDIMAPEGTPVYASLGGGTVVKAERQDWTSSGKPAATGGIVTIRYDNGIEAKYMHLSDVTKVKPGQRIAPGQLIALSGYSPAARSAGAHLHLEYRDKQGNLLDAAKIHGWGATGRTGEGLAGTKVSAQGGTGSPYAPGTGVPGFAGVPFTQDVPGFSVGGNIPQVNIAPEPHEQPQQFLPMTVTGPPGRRATDVHLPRPRPASAPQVFPPMTIRDRHEEENQRETRRARAFPPMRVTRSTVAGSGGDSQISIDRSAIDKSIAGQHGGSIGSAQVNVKFDNVPK